MKTKYKATDANGACRISNASNVKTLASTIRNVPLKRPGAGCRSCQTLAAHAAREFAREGSAKGGRDETTTDEEGFSIALISPL
jgi:hypothetical protein